MHVSIMICMIFLGRAPKSFKYEDLFDEVMGDHHPEVNVPTLDSADKEVATTNQ